ncbi:MAG: SDR family NAD(P)-dependent oxidoreductase [Halieaceae bacterium]|jgi:NAD(P)-dependent dehydrogenase (short-subunit alcohol dehydrogenase family)|nr:SDR family NAD(P)-dependent oxidoreductase [Halieaceae bacterium]
MIILEEKIHAPRSAREAFDYVADFRSSAEWDATAFEAHKLTEGPVAVGTRFKVRCKLPVGSVLIDYEVTDCSSPSVISLAADCWLFSGVDTIRFTDAAEGCDIDYRAEFSFKGPFASLEGSLEPGMQAMGRKAVAGLLEALEDNYEAPTASNSTQRADRLVWPGLALFSKFGYRRGRKHFKPISASLRGRRMIVTGASSGLGLATARSLAERGADLVLVMRNEDKASSVVAELIGETGNEHIRYEIADLSLLADVDSLASKLLQEDRPIDVLVNNAGALFNDWGQTSEGLEQSFALLLLSPWRLTRALQPLLARAEGRVINVLSGGMYSQKLSVKHLQAREEGYAGAAAYARCKRALMVVTEEWAEAWADQGIVVNAMHPGWANTPGVESALPGFHRITRHILRTPEEGADTIVWLAAATEARELSGKLFLDREPRTTHLLARTRENDGGAERTRLMEFLQEFDAATGSEAA